MKISCPDSESTQKTSLDTGWTTPFGGGHPTLISATITDLAILGVIVRILHFSVQMWILLKKLVQTQVKTIPFRRGHPILISATIIDLAILRATGRILHFSVQIWILLEKLVQIQVEPSKTEVVKIWNHQGSISILYFLAQRGKVPAWGHWIWNLLKKAHPMIPISSILSWF
jgi:hypothetical protein